MTAAPARRILWVDDDVYELDFWIHQLSMEGYCVETAGDVQSAKQLIAANPPDLAILDMMLPLGDDAESRLEARGGFASGMVLARWIKINHPTVRFVGCSVLPDLEVGRFFEQYGCGFIRKTHASGRDIVRLVSHALETPNPALKLRVFIVHGHDESAKLELKNYLQNVLTLPEPKILHELPSTGRSIMEKFEAAAEDVDIVFVLLTPDDKVATATESNKAKWRARQNVIFELGYFLSALHRRSGRVVLLHKGPLELPSDISGLTYIDISSGIAAAGEEIRRELAAGM